MDPEETECVLPADTVSLLVQENLQKEDATDWVTDWFSDCRLEVGTTIRIPYDPDEIATLSETFESVQPLDVVEDVPVATASPSSPSIDVDKEGGNSYDLLVAEDTAMPEETDNELVAQVADSTGDLVGEFGNLAQSTQDPTLTLLLAVVAVVGGGAAWKFYRQHSEQKHEQKMAQMKMDAKSKGMEGQSPGPCQTVHAQLKAEVEEIKSRMGKMDKKLSLNADFDGDDLERKVKKLEKWRKSLEEDDE